MKRLTLLATSLLALTGCFEDIGECDTGSEASSVTVSVWYADDSPASSDYATYSIDGSAEYDCESLDSTGHEYICGWEETGYFTISVYVGGSVYTGDVNVPMGWDGCHPDSRFIDIYVD